MKIVIIQEAGRHEANREFREALSLNHALNKIDGVESKVWGLNYETFSTPFSEIEKWADVLFIIENYTSEWLPASSINASKKLKIFWSIDSHCVLLQHQNMCRTLGIDILLNSTEDYLPMFDGLVNRRYWFPNAYPSNLIHYMPEVQKEYSLGFCGNFLNRKDWIDHLGKFNIKNDIFVIGNDMVRAINSYKIHFNRNIANDINYRTFETTGCRTLLITNHTPCLERLFDINNEIIVYSDMNDLDDKIKYYLNNEAERIKIETAGWERAKRDHTYDNRASMLIEIINEK